MSILNKRQAKVKGMAYVDSDYVAFHVEDEFVDHVVDYLLSSIIANCMMEYGETPTVF